MRFSSDLLFALARASSALLDGREGELEVGTDLSPVITVPRAVRDQTSVITRTVAERQSFITSLNVTRTASQAASTVTVCTFARGLWSVLVLGSLLADFTDTPASTFNSGVQIQDPDGNNVLLMAFSHQANVPQYRDVFFSWLFTRDGWSLVLTGGATGVAQTLVINSIIHANLLL